VDEFQGVLDDSASHQLFTRVATEPHQSAGKALGDRALSLSEPLTLISTRSMRNIARMLSFHCDEVFQ
jgi:hypothetical protein